MKKMNPTMLAILSTLTTGGAVFVAPSQAFASTNYYSTGIYVDGNSVSSPKHIDAYDGGNLTAFLPLFYINQTLRKYGFTGKWDGNNWDISVPQGTGVNLDNPQSGQQTNANTLSMSINGEVIQFAPRQVAVDPASGQSTTYLPIWYIDQVIGRLGIQASWSGTVWGMQKIVPETQQEMASKMWQVFNATKYNVDHYATMQEANVSPATGSVTAGDIANWLLQWASKSKWYKDSVYAGGAYHPYSLTSETSSDPFTWTQQNGLWSGTSIASSSTVISLSDVSKVISNLTWWLNGYKVQNGIYTLHVPFADHYPLWHGACVLNPYPTSEYQIGMADDTYCYDQIQVWSTDGWKTVHVKLPSTVGSSGKVTLGVNGDHGAFNYGNFAGNGSQVNSSDEGGLTLTFSNPSDAPGFATAVSAEGVISENKYAGVELDTIYRNVNGIPDVSNPVDEAAGQE